MDIENMDPKELRKLRDKLNFPDVRLRYDLTRSRYPDCTNTAEEFERIAKENEKPQVSK